MHVYAIKEGVDERQRPMLLVLLSRFRLMVSLVSVLILIIIITPPASWGRPRRSSCSRPHFLGIIVIVIIRHRGPSAAIGPLLSISSSCPVHPSTAVRWWC